MNKEKFIKHVIAANPIVLIFAFAASVFLIGNCLLYLILWLTSGIAAIRYVFYPSMASFLSLIGLLFVYAYCLKWHGSLLNYAVLSRRKRFVKWLITKDANVNAATKSGWTVLHDASCLGDRDIVETLIRAGALVNQKDEFGQAPLHIAAIRGNVDIAELLIANGADVNTRNNQRNTPLDIATKAGHAELETILREHGGI